MKQKLFLLFTISLLFFIKNDKVFSNNLSKDRLYQSKDRLYQSQDFIRIKTELQSGKCSNKINSISLVGEDVGRLELTKYFKLLINPDLKRIINYSKKELIINSLWKIPYKYIRFVKLTKTKNQKGCNYEVFIKKV